MRKPLPFEKQDWTVLAQRYDVALERLWVIGEIPDGDSPTLMREHVFDCPTGIRLVVSRDSHDGRETVHVSANIDPRHVPEHIDGLLRMMHPKASWDAVVKMIREAFQKISGIDLPACPEMVTGLGITHWIIPNNSDSRT